MRILDLFAGSRSVGDVAACLGHETFSTDIIPFKGIDYAVDIMDFDPSRVPFVPDMIWASPPCQGFSVASIGRNWGGGKLGYVPKSERARTGIALVRKTIEIIGYYTGKNPGLVWFIENPRGLLRKMPFMKDLRRHTVSYCQYGDTRMKPTDIWTNSTAWSPRPMCRNGAPCHTPAPRGAKTGTQGLKDGFERSRIPRDLCAEAMDAAMREGEKHAQP